VWRQQAENAAESLSKGDLVVCIGKLQNRKWEDKEGNTRYSLEMQADTVAISLLFRTVKHGAQRSQRKSADDDPWASPPPSSDDPPF
jgi:single-strand DNA-binding protein